MKPPALQLDKVVVELVSKERTFRVLRDVDLIVQSGEVVALVGESGSGKSMCLKAVLGLLPDSARVRSGNITVAGVPLPSADKKRMREMRRRVIGFIPQDPISCFNPSLTIGVQVTRLLKLYGPPRTRSELRQAAAELLRRVGVDPEGKLDQYPFNFSQGQLQRIMIAMSLLSRRPELVLADEPTTSLDVTIEAQVLWLIAELQRSAGFGVLFVTHDVALVAQIADKTAVMYAGTIVEFGLTIEIFNSAMHPYTAALLRSSRAVTETDKGRRFDAIPGAPAGAAWLGGGCAFAPRCPLASDICERDSPPLRPLGSRYVACHHAGG